jgi:hypothetical protein
MPARRRARALATVSAVAGLLAAVSPATAADDQINTLAEIYARIRACWKPPAPPIGDPGMEITVIMAFKRDGSLLSKPTIVYETHSASEQDRTIYTTAVAEALQRCTPMPFTEQLGGAVAGRPIRLRFDARRTKSTERTSWQTTRTL